MFHKETDKSVTQYRRRVQDLVRCRVLAPVSDHDTLDTIMTELRAPRTLHYMAHRAFAGVVLMSALAANAVADVHNIVSIDGDCFTLKRTLYCKNFPQGDVDSGSTFCIAK